MSKQVQMDVVLPQSPERVWRAITDPNALAQWLMPNDFRPRIGHRFRFQPERGREKQRGEVIECEVVELDAPHRLAYTWRESAEGAPDLVTWVLEPVEAGTRIRLEHTRLTEVSGEMNFFAEGADNVLGAASSAPTDRLFSPGHEWHGLSHRKPGEPGGYQSSSPVYGAYDNQAEPFMAGLSVALPEFLMVRLAHFLTKPRSSRPLVRGRVMLSAGSAFTCVAISPSAIRSEEVVR